VVIGAYGDRFAPPPLLERMIAEGRLDVRGLCGPAWSTVSWAEPAALVDSACHP
jgi:hypothetical protein